MPNKVFNSLERSGLYLTVFLTGAAVMVIELLGTRLIAPFYGASLYVWSSLISVTMLALAVGYFVGGRWADKARRTGLSLIVGLAAVLTLLIPWLTRPVLLATDPLGLRFGALASALVLFMPSLTLLGMVGPFAIKMATARLDGVGASAGSIYAVSTLGSVAGTLGLGFFLFPVIGSREIFIGTGVYLLALSFALALFEQKRLGLRGAVMTSASLLLIGFGLLPKIVDAGHVRPDAKFKLRSEQESLYGWVRVIDQPARNLRMLTSDASMIGAAGISDGGNRLSYQDIVDLLPALRPGMTRALIVGLGAGKMVDALQDRYGIRVDTLEIDPAVADAARRYFGFRGAGNNVVGDARYEIRHLQGPYDLIIHDCFTGGSEPAHLLTVETLLQLKGLLAPGGLLAVNFVSFADLKDNLALPSVAKTIARVFPEQASFISEPGKDFNDFIFLASTRPIDLSAPSLFGDQRDWLQQRRFPIDPARGTVLTDNLNPIEHLQVKKSEHYRNMLVEWFGVELLVR